MQASGNVVRFQPPADCMDVDVTHRQRTSRQRLAKGSDYFTEGEVEIKRETRVDMFESTDEVNRMVSYFLERGDYRDAFLIVLGCNTGLRPEDLMDYRWRNIFDGDTLKYVHVKKERKTQKNRYVYLNQAVSEMAWLYRKHLGDEYNPDSYCFASCGPRKGHVPQDWRKDEKDKRVYSIETQPMHTRSVTRIIRNAAKELGMYRDDRRLASYSMRKTAISAPTGLVKGISRSDELEEVVKGLPIAQLIGNHANEQTTLNNYLSVKKHILEEAYETMNFGLEAIRAHTKKEKM